MKLLKSLYNHSLQIKKAILIFLITGGITVTGLGQTPVAQYDFTGDATDASGNGLDGTVNGAFLTSDRFSNSNNAYSFNGFSYIAVPTDPSIEFGSATDFSISGWFRTSETSGVIFDKSDGFSGFLAFFPDDFSNQITFYMIQDGVGDGYLTSSAGYNDGFWHHFVFQADRDLGMEIYIDGVLDASNSTLTNFINIDTPEDFLIGVAGEAGNTNLNTYFNGRLDDFKIYNYALSSTEITAEYEAVNPVIETAELVAKYDFNGDLIDGGSNSYDGTANGGATPTIDRFSTANSAYAFDGTGYISSSYSSLYTDPNPKSLSVWFKTTSFGGDLISWGIHDPYGFSMGYDISITNSSIRFAYANGTDPNNAPFTSSTTANVTVSADSWHHFAYSIKDGNKISFYLDNVLIHNATLNNPSWWTESYKALHIGEGFIGDIDDVRFYNGPIDATEVDALFNESGPIVSIIPTITSFTPAYGPIGTTVTITGTNFSSTPSSNIVFFGATKATVTDATATSLTVTVPSGATYQPITVLVDGLLAYASAPFVVTFTGGGTIDASSFDVNIDFTTGTNPYSVSIGDLDGDGKLDLAVVHLGEATVSVFRNTSIGEGSVSYDAKVDYATGTDPYSVAIADLDGDGKLDLAVANFSGNTVSVFRNTSTGSGSISYDDKVDFATGALPASVAIGDLDGDGKSDLVVANYSGNTVSVIRNTSSGSGVISFDTKVDFITGTNPFSVATGDLDGDGKSDLAVGNYNSGTVSVLRNTSTGSGTITFETRLDYLIGDQPYSVVIGDLDGDRKSDLAVANYTGNTVSVLRNTSTGPGTISYDTKVDFVSGTQPYSVSIGDLDGDGKLDLAVANEGSTTFSVYRNTSTGSGTISYDTKVDYAIETTAYSVAIGDLDGDGKSDLVVPKYSYNTVSVFRNAIVSPTTYLVAQYDFTGDATDASGNGFDGTVNGGSTLMEDRFGNLDAAYAFTSGQYISSNQTFDADSPFSFSVWVNWSGNGGNFQSILTWWANTGRVYLDVAAAGELRFGDGYGPSGIFLPKNQWVHIVGTNDATSTSKIYMNGVLVGEKNINTDYQQPGTLRIGGDNAGAHIGFEGTIDDVSIYNYVLSDGEVADLFGQGGWQTQASLVAQYDFTNGDLTDVSGNGFDATVTGATLTTDRFGTLDAAYSFNGIDNIISAPNVVGYPSFSASAWFRSSYDFSSGWANFYDLSGGFGFAIGQNNQLEGTMQYGPDNWIVLSSGVTANDGNWHHAGFTFDGNVSTLYIDGIKVDEHTNYSGSATYISNPTALQFGHVIADTERYFTGEIDDPKYYSGALTAGEIQTLYSENGWTSSIVAKVGYYLDGPNGFANNITLDGYIDRWGAVVNVPEASNLFFYFNDDLGNLYGDNENDGVSDLSGVGIPVTTGLYYVTINSSDNSYQVAPIARMGLIGSARTGSDNDGWIDPDTEMTPDAQLGVYNLLSYPLFNGEIKFRANNDWNQGNWGDNNGDGILDVNGQNIPVNLGVYDISVDIVNNNYSLTSVGSQRTTDSLALVSLYNSTDGANWKDNTNWLSGSIDTWFGVSVINDRVDSVNLINNNLVGSIPTSIGSLSGIRVLYLNNNALSGSIPTQIGNLTNLDQLGLSNNKLSGTIPIEIGNLTNLTFLTLRTNRLTGAVPSEITNLTNLQQLYLFANQLDGLPDLTSLTNLSVFYLYNNKIGFSDLISNVSIGNVGGEYRWAPQVLGDSLRQDYNLGDLVSLSVNEFTLGTTYQWLFNGDTIVGATDYFYETTFSTEGIYTCQLENSSLPHPAGIQYITASAPFIVSDGVNQTPSSASLYLFQPNDGYPVFINEGLPVNTFVAAIDIVDDIVDTHTFTLVSGTGSTHNDLVTITGNVIRTAAVLDYAVTPFLEILVQVTDNQGASITQAFVIDVQPVPECLNEVFTATSGTFTDGSDTFNYPNSFSCSWLIDLPTDYIITLGFSEFDIEQDFDFVFVYDGPDSSAPLIGQFSGTSIPAELISTSNQLYIEFISDQLVNAGGWSAYYSATKAYEVGQVGYYTFTGGSTADESGFGNDGVATGGALFSTDRYGYGASSFEPENNGNFIEINHGGSWDLNGEVALSAWVRTNGAEDTNNYNDIFVNEGFGYFYLQGNELVYWFGGPYIATVNNPFVHKQWNYVTLTIDVNSTARIYINGIEQEIFYSEEPSNGAGFGKTISRPSSTSNFFYIATPYAQAERYFYGDIDDARIFAGATLTGEQILTIYNNERPDDLRVDFPFNTASLANETGYGYTGNFLDVNGTSISPITTSDRFGDPEGAMLFQDNGNSIHVFHERTLNARNSFTVNMWINPTTFASGADFGDILFSDNSGGRLMIGQGGTLAYHYGANGNTSFPFIASDFNTIQTGVWQNVSLTVDENNQVRLYRNGVPLDLFLDGNALGTSADVSNYDSYGNPDRFIIAPAEVIVGSPSDIRFYNGAIDDFTFYQRALTDLEISEQFFVEDNRLIAYYPFNGNPIDETGNGYDGSVAGAVLTADRYGNANSAYYFDGTTSSIQVPTLNASPSFTQTFWLNSESGIENFYRTIIDYGSDSPYTGLYEGKLLSYLGAGDSDDFPASRWTFGAVTYDAGSGESKVFINGILKATAIVTLNTSGLGMGIGYYQGDSGFLGSIDEVRIFDQALSDTEIASIYEVEKYFDPLLAYYPFNGNTNDASAYGNNATSIGATLSTDRFNSPDQAYSFDGSSYLAAPDAAHLSIGTDTDLAIMGWFNTSVGSGVLFDKSDGSVGYFGMVQADGSLLFFMTQNGFSFSVTSTAGWADGRWHHFVMQSDRQSVLEIYIDGSLTAETFDATNQINPDTPEDFLIGVAGETGNTNLNTFFNGSIDEISVYAQTFSGTEILDRYLSEVPSAPVAPSIVNVKVVSPTSIEVYWNDNSDNETEFAVNVYIDQLSNGLQNVVSQVLPANSTSAYITSLTTDQEYLIEVVAANGFGAVGSTYYYVTPVQLAQPIVTVSPSIFTLDDEITITYFPDRSYPAGELVGQSPIYFHSGLVQLGNESGPWDGSTVVGNWGLDDGVGVMTDNFDGSWSITFVPRNYYLNLTPSYEAVQIGMVFRNAAGDLTGKGPENTDIYIDVYNTGTLVRPATNFLSFDGSSFLANTAADVGNENAWIALNALTVEAWIIPQGFPAEGTWWDVASRTNDELDWAYELYLYTESGINYIVWEVYDGVTRVTSVYQIDDAWTGDWSHLAGTYDGANSYLYLNGNLIASSVGSSNFSSTYPNEILEVGSNGYVGSIDEVRLWNYARTQAEIRGIIQQEITDPIAESGLVGYWPMNDLYTDGTIFYTPDLTSNGNDLFVAGEIIVQELPDLEVSIVTQPTQLLLGSNGSVAINLLNNTNTSAVQTNVITQVYLSSNTIFDGNDISIFNDLREINIAAFNSLDLTYDFVVPSNLAVGTYYLIVRTDITNALEEIDENNNQVVSSVIDVVDLAPLDLPGNLVANSVTNSSFSIAWNAVTDATDYQYELSTDNAFSNIINSNSTTSTVVDFTGLSTNTTYYFRVRANDSNTSRVSGYVTGSATTLDIAPLGVPGNVTTSSITVSSFRLTWDAVTDATDYQYQLYSDAAFTNVLVDNSTTDLFADFSSLATNTTYYFRVRANDSNTSRTSSYVSGSATTLDLPVLAAPSNITSSSTTSSFTLSWSAVAGANQYVYDISRNAGFTDFLVQNISVSTPGFGITSGLNYNTTYFYRIKAVDTGTSRESAYASGNVSTLNDTTPPTILISSPTNKSEPTDITVTVTAGDNFGVAQVKFYKRGVLASIGSESVTTLTPSSGGLVTAQFNVVISASDFDASGISFYAIAFDEAGNQSEVSGLKTITRDIPVNDIQEITNIVQGNTETSYQILAYPYATTPVATVLGFQQDPTKWRVANWNGSANNYAVSSFEAGKGYWLLVGDDANFTGSFTFNNVDPIAVDEAFTLPLRAGWTQIGNPFLFEINWTEVVSYNEGLGIITSNEAQTLAAMYIYQGGWNLSTTKRLDVYQGAFVNSPRAINNFLIPLTAYSGNRVAQENSLIRNELYLDGGWELGLDIRVNGGLRYGISGLGQSKQSDMGLDNFDLKTPMLFDRFIKAEFIEGTLEGLNVARSIHNLNDNDVWTMSLDASYKPGTAMTFNFNGIVDLADGESLVMLDMNTGKSVEVYSGLTYKYTYRSGSVFKFIKGDAEFINAELIQSRFYVTDAYPNPTEGLFSLPVYIPDLGINEIALAVDMYDLSGRKVLSNTHVLTPGTNLLSYNLSSGEYESGVYLVEITYYDRKITKKVYLKTNK